MQDVTSDVLKAFDRSSGAKIERWTRLDMLNDKLKTAASRLNRRKKLRIVVLGPDGEVEQEEVGDLQSARELVEDYNATHMMRIQADIRRNAIVIRIGKRLAREADNWHPGDDNPAVRVW